MCASLLTSLGRAGIRLRWCRLAVRGSVRRRRGLDDGDRAVVLHKYLVGHAFDVFLADLVEFIHFAEQLTPIAIAKLIGRQVLRQPRIVSEAADETCFSARLHRA